MHAAATVHSPTPTARGRGARVPFWLTATGLLVVGLVVLGCTSPKGFPEPFAEGEVLRSDLSIPPGQTFLLGGGQPAGFIVQAYNDGGVPVSLTGDPATDDARETTIYPDNLSEAAFTPGQTALLTNESDDQTARLKVTITSLQPGQTLGMRYVDR